MLSGRPSARSGGRQSISLLLNSMRRRGRLQEKSLSRFRSYLLPPPLFMLPSVFFPILSSFSSSCSLKLPLLLLLLLLLVLRSLLLHKPLFLILQSSSLLLPPPLLPSFSWKPRQSRMRRRTGASRSSSSSNLLLLSGARERGNGGRETRKEAGIVFPHQIRTSWRSSNELDEQSLPPRG